MINDKKYYTLDEMISIVLTRYPISRSRIESLIDGKYIPHIMFYENKNSHGPFFCIDKVLDWMFRNIKSKEYKGKSLPKITIQKYSNPPHEDVVDIKDLPFELKKLHGMIFSIDYTKKSGIYFLIKRCKITYIGKSTNTRNRIQDHSLTNKDFDKAYFLPLEEEFLDDYEMAFIKTLKPIDNGMYKDCKIKKSEKTVIDMLGLKNDR